MVKNRGRGEKYMAGSGCKFPHCKPISANVNVRQWIRVEGGGVYYSITMTNVGDWEGGGAVAALQA